MDWKACGFRISQLQEALTYGPSSIAVNKPERVQGYTDDGDYTFLDFATAEAVQTNGGEWGWYVTRTDPIPEDVKRYLIDELNFPEEWLAPEWAIFPLDEYEPAWRYASEKMHYGFRVNTSVCNSLVTRSGAAEVVDTSARVANKPYWRSAFFGYTLPLLAQFQFIVDNTGYTLTPLGTWAYISSKIHEEQFREPYEAIMPPNGDDPGKPEVEGTRIRVFGGSVLFPTDDFDQYANGWQPSPENELRTFTLANGKRYFYGWGSENINDFMWGEIIDITIPFTFANVRTTEPQITVGERSIEVHYLRSPRRYDIAVDITAIANANTWDEPSDALYNEVYAQIVAIEQSYNVSAGFYPIAVYNPTRIGGSWSSGGYVLPSATASVINAGNPPTPDITADDVISATVRGTATEIAPAAAAIHHELTIRRGICRWQDPTEYAITFNSSEDWASAPVYYPGKDGYRITDGQISAEQFIQDIGGDAELAGNVSGEVYLNSQIFEDYGDQVGIEDVGCNLTWSVSYGK